MKTIVWLLGALLVLGVAKAAFIWSGIYNIAADEPHWRVTERAMETLRDRSIAARASGLAVPDLEDESAIRVGAGNYDAMCVGCHLEPGLESTEASKGLYPAPPDLTEERVEDPAAAFWVIKHGIKMSGMPAWGKSIEDEYVWGMVAFLRRLPGLSPDEYQVLVEASGGHQHGGAESAAVEEDEGTDEHAEGEAGERHSHEPEESSRDDDHSKALPHQH